MTGICHQAGDAIFGVQVVLVGVDGQCPQGFHVGVAVYGVHTHLVEQHSFNCWSDFLHPRRNDIHRLRKRHLAIWKQ